MCCNLVDFVIVKIQIFTIQIINMFKKQLNKPFPLIKKTKHKIFVSFFISTSIFVILLVFQPFRLNEIQYYKPIFIAGFFVITLFTTLVCLFVLPKIFPKLFDEDKWTIKKDVIFILFQILIIAILNWLYNSTVGKDITEQYNIFSSILITISVGFFPTILHVLTKEKYLTKKHTQIAQNITNRIQTENKKTEEQKIKISSENNNEQINIKSDELICIKSEGNYANVYFYLDSKLNKQLLRNSLTKLDKQLIIFENIKRCHRSYIVNFDNVEKVTGNARNYNLHITNLDFTVPVSRSFPKNIIEMYK